MRAAYERSWRTGPGSLLRASPNPQASNPTHRHRAAQRGARPTAPPDAGFAPRAQSPLSGRPARSPDRAPRTRRQRLTQSPDQTDPIRRAVQHGPSVLDHAPDRGLTFQSAIAAATPVHLKGVPSVAFSTPLLLAIYWPTCHIGGAGRSLSDSPSSLSRRGDGVVDEDGGDGGGGREGVGVEDPGAGRGAVEE